jgi:Na+(H+)/acetate symporter ActP
MNTNMQGHNHGGKNHLLWMLGIGGVVLVVLLGTGRSFQQALPYALFLACPLMMVGMMFMMRGGNGQQQGHDTTDHRDRSDAVVHHDNDAPETWQDSPNITPPQSPPASPRL